jgi:alkaline phosphatase
MNRRAFFRQGSLYLLAADLACSSWQSVLGQQPDSPAVKIGMLTDLHYADIPPAGTRFYRQSIDKLAEAQEKLSEYGPNFIVQLGDLIDAAATVEGEKQHLAVINQQLVKLPGDKHYVLGNHCIYTLTKPEFLEGIGREKSYYSFDSGGFHFVVLDACFRQDGQPYGRKNNQWTDSAIPQVELDWLATDLQTTQHKCVIYIHQRLDDTRQHSVKNNQQVRQILQDSGKVLCVFQGHSHANDYQRIGDIHYCTLVAMVEGSGPENNAYCTLDVFGDGTLRLTGFRKQKSYMWT